MITLLYIGYNKEYLSKFSQIEEVRLIQAMDYQEAITIYSSEAKANNSCNIVIYEQGNLNEDITKITKFRKKFYQVYFVLITHGLTKEESATYLQCGINDTINPDITANELQEKIELIKKRQELLYANDRNKKEVKRFILPTWKRIFDIVFSLIALILFLPIFILIAIAIRIESKGPIIYKSKRVGSNYTIFDFFKFRSMYVDSDKHLNELASQNQYQNDTEEPIQAQQFSQEELGNLMIGDDGVMLISDDFIIPEEEFANVRNSDNTSVFVKIEHDPRVTKVGRFLRKFSLDELPQLFNILRGDMSVVGNRPLPLYEAELLTNDDSIDRFMAPAGLTGLWQVEKRGDSGKLSAKERKELDIRYGKEFSFWYDIKIILRTLTAFVQKGDC